LDVVAISERCEVAGIAAAILRGKDIGGYNPHISAACVSSTTSRSPFLITGKDQKFNIEIATSYLVIDARHVDLWLALDKTSNERVHTYLLHNGPSPNNFYRGVFPDPIVFCGFDIPWIPKTSAGLDDWLNSLTENLKPWKESIWRAYSDSS